MLATLEDKRNRINDKEKATQEATEQGGTDRSSIWARPIGLEGSQLQGRREINKSYFPPESKQ